MALPLRVALAAAFALLALAPAASAENLVSETFMLVRDTAHEHVPPPSGCGLDDPLQKCVGICYDPESQNVGGAIDLDC